ncbi:MAG TPA: FG-GAP-like repeat-containing protein [Thermoanaerobaculia bacterium]
MKVSLSVIVLALLAPFAAANEPYLVKEINPHVSPTSSFPDHFQTIGNLVFFNTTDYYGYPQQLWRTDGSDFGTIFLHNADSTAVAFNGKAWFTSGGGLWSSDGTIEGTQQLTLPVVSPALTPNSLMASSSALYFYAGPGKTSIWTTDGTTAGTHQVTTKTFVPGVNAIQIEYYQNWAAAGSNLYFIADDGTGFSVWRTNGSAMSLIDGPPSGWYVIALQSFGNIVLYQKISSGGYQSQQQYWRTDGTQAGTYALSANGQPLYYDGYFRNVVVSGGSLYFVGNDGTGRKLWRSNGTSAGTAAVATSLPGASATFDGNLLCALANGTLILSGPPVGANDVLGLWSWDGTNTTFLANAGYGNTAQAAVAAGSYAVFGTHGDLWRTDGTIGGTYILATTNGSDGYHNWPMSALGTSVLMNGYDATSGYELWKTDGTIGNTARLKDLLVTTYGSNPAKLTRLKNGVAFFANSNATSDGYPGTSTELWFSDGTDAGTQQLLADGNYTGSIASCGGTAFFSHDTPATGTELWTSDGTAAGTSMLLDLYPGTTPPYTNSGNPSYFTCIDTTMYFFAYDRDGWALWRSDATAPGTYKIKNTVALSQPVQFGHGLMFLADRVLWISNGTAEGTYPIKTFDQVSYTGLLSAGGYAYLAAGSGSAELWRSNASAAGTTAILSGSYFEPHMEMNGRAIFGAGGPSLTGSCSIGDAGDVYCFDSAMVLPYYATPKVFNGRLYYINGHVKSTDLFTPAVDTGITAGRLLAAAGGRLYMQPDSYYSALQETDGTVAGTKTFSLSLGQNPELVESGGRLFISQYELYAYDLEVAALSMAPQSVASPGGQQITINGRGFIAPVKVLVGGSMATVGSATSNSVTFTAPSHDTGAYKVVLTTADGRTIDVNTPLVYTCSGPSAVINSTPGPVCPMVPVHLQGGGGTQCHWYPAAGLDNPASCSPTATLSRTTTYTLVVQNASGCPSSNNPTVTVQIFPAPDSTITLPSTTLIPGNTYSASVPDAGPGATYQWSGTSVTIPDPTQRTISFQPGCGPAKLNVVVTNVNGCSTAFSANLYVYAAMTVKSITPIYARPGMAMTLIGTGFQCVNSVTINFGSIPVPFEVENATTIQLRYPPNGVAGSIYASTPSSGGRTSWIYRSYRDDMSGDGSSDIVWRRPAGGETLIWSLSPTGAITTLTPAVRGSGTTDYKVVGIHEIGGYLYPSDILWQRTSTGELSTTYMAPPGVTQLPEKAWPVIPPPTLKVAAMGDLDGDGFGEAIMRDTQTGATSLWKFDHNSFSQTPIHAGGNLDWTIVAARDFDFDGKDDILWRHTSGMTLIWFMNGAAIRSSAAVHSGGNTDWSIAGAGDFDGDGKADILWRHNPTGMTLLWQLNGAQIIASTVVHSGSNQNWTIAALGDYDGDSKTDILWRENNTGMTLYWRMSGPQIVSSVLLHGGGNLDWQIEAPR